MEQLSFKLEVFEGPMDLLLNLIVKHKLNIYDIEIAKLLDQYMEYLELAKEANLELAGEFLEMAARLIYIKTAALLPRPEEAEKVKQELQGALIEYALCKQAARTLKQRYIGGSVFTRKPMKLEVPQTYGCIHNSKVLLDAWRAMGKKRFSEPTNTQQDKLRERVVTPPVVSVTSKLLYIMRKVYHNEHVYLGEVYAETRGRSARVAVFLAILELVKHGRMGISEDGSYVYRLEYSKRKRKMQTVEEVIQEETEGENG